MPIPNVETQLRDITEQLKPYDFITNSRLEAELLMCHVLRCDRLKLQLKLDYSLSEDENKKLAQALNQRCQNVPLAYITKQKEFYGRNFFVDQRVLIPRPESEIMVEETLKICEQIISTSISAQFSNQKIKIIDVGCGSGVLGISLALELSKKNIPYELALSDISPAALDVAKINTQNYNISAELICSDLLNHLSHTTDRYDIILANLPYVDKSWGFISNVDYEPDLALYTDNHGLDLIHKLIHQITSLNKNFNRTWLLLESDPIQQANIYQTLRSHNFSNIKQVGYITIAYLPDVITS